MYLNHTKLQLALTDKIPTTPAPTGAAPSVTHRSHIGGEIPAATVSTNQMTDDQSCDQSDDRWTNLQQVGGKPGANTNTALHAVQ